MIQVHSNRVKRERGVQSVCALDIGYGRTKRGREICPVPKHKVKGLPRGDKTELLGIGHTGGDLRVLENESLNCTDEE